MLSMIQSLGDQIRWAVGLDVPGDFPRTSEVLLVGMGGSGVSGDYLAAATAADGLRVSVHKGYGLPTWAKGARPLVIAASYSGNTEETLDAVGEASASGLPIVSITTGGRLGELSLERGWPMISVPTGVQPRAALGYLFGGVLRITASAGLIDDPSPSLSKAADLADEAVVDGSRAWRLAESISRGLAGRITIVYGGGPLSGTVASRWKTQINENAKMPAWASVLPELDHNEIVGWETLPDLTYSSVGIVALSDSADHPRIADRLDHTSSLTGDAVPWVGRVSSWGDTAVERLISLTAVGDLTSWMMAVQAKVDPVPVGTIEKLKALLKD